MVVKLVGHKYEVTEDKARFAVLTSLVALAAFTAAQVWLAATGAF